MRRVGVLDEVGVFDEVGSQLHPQSIGDNGHILVSPAGEVDQNNVVLRQISRHLRGVVDGVGGFQRGDDAFSFA